MNSKGFLALLLLCACSSASMAASMTFTINVENAVAPHGTPGNYGTVTISDVMDTTNTLCDDSNFGTDCVLFDVDFGGSLDPSDEVNNFAFNQSSDILTSSTEFFFPTESSSSTVSFDQTADGFGVYDVMINVNPTVDPFVFVVDHDDASDFWSKWTTTNSTGPCGKGPTYSCLFAANVAGTGNSWVGHQQVVPIPAALWLFGSGLLGLVGIARRKKAA